MTEPFYGAPEWVLARRLARHVNHVFKTLKLSEYQISEKSILSGILEERHDRRETVSETFIQFSADLYSSYVSEAKLQNSYKNSGSQDKKFEWEDKFINPTTIDVGPGNIHINKAIRLLEKYNRDYPKSDPLNLKKYNDRYREFVSALNDGEDLHVTAALAGLVTKESAQWLKRNTGNWHTLTQREKEGLLSYAYNVGIPRLEQNKADALKAGTPYNPDVANTPIIQEYLKNVDEIEKQYKKGLNDPRPDPKPVPTPDLSNEHARLTTPQFDRPSLLPTNSSKPIESKQPKPSKKQYAPHILKPPAPQQSSITSLIEKPMPLAHKSRMEAALKDENKNKAVKLAFSDEQSVKTPPVKHQLAFPSIKPERTEQIEPARSFIDDGSIEQPREANTDHDIDLSSLSEPTAEMLENNVFTPDENGLTNLTEEAIIWKKNKKLAVDLITHAGRLKEFEPVLAFEELS